jgi:hypothetical protein
MRELGQTVGYIFAAAILTCGSIAALHLTVIELVQIRTAKATSTAESRFTPPNPHVVESERAHNARPVWIAATPRYQYDPKLMAVNPRNELRREAELRRRQELAKHEARQRETTRRERRLRDAREAYAFAPQLPRPDFLMFPFIR